MFTNIYKFKQSKKKSPLEDYCTEIFVYIFKKLITSKHSVSLKLLKLFGLSNINERNLRNIDIVTHEYHWVNQKKVIPDILIKFQNKIVAIEVKIDSGLRYYRISKNQYIDQIKLYKNINDIHIDEVFTLSKYNIISNSIKSSNKILWSNIYSLLFNIKNEVIENFLLLLEENGMKPFILNNGAENTIDSICAITNLIEKSWMYEKYPIKKPEITREYIGYWVKNNKTAWIGQLAEKKEYIVFLLFDKKLIKKADKIFTQTDDSLDLDKHGQVIYAKIPIKNIVLYKTEKKQLEFFQDWVNREIGKILHE